MAFLLKKITAPLLLASFLTVALLSFAAMSFGSDGRMQGDCPFSATGVELCGQDALAAVMHHINAYQSFANIPVDSAILALMSALLLVAFLLVLRIHPPLLEPPTRNGYFNTGPPVSARTRKMTRWLSLLENSPTPL